MAAVTPAKELPIPDSPTKVDEIDLAAEPETTTIGEGGDENEDPDEAILAKLKKYPKKKKNPNAKWDGKFAGMSLKEYRERKWSVDACYAKVERRGPSFSMRPSLPASFEKRNKNFQVGDIFRSLSATLPTAPSYGMGIQVINNEKEVSQGPGEYHIKNTMDPSKHPTMLKSVGARFSSDVLEPRDPPGPAPGQYEVDDAIVYSSTIKKTPNFSIQGREAWAPRTAAPNPDPGEYNFAKGLTQGTTKHGKLTPIHWNMQGKTFPLKRPLGQRAIIEPGPGHYGVPGAWPEKVNPNRPNPITTKFSTENRGLR